METLRQAEEEAWARLPTDLPFPSESEGVLSDVDEACLPKLRTGFGLAARDADGRNSPPGGENDLHGELEIEIPVVGDVGVGHEEAEDGEALRRRVEMLRPEGGGGGPKEGCGGGGWEGYSFVAFLSI